MGNNRNTILAFALSMAILLIWQFMYVTPRIEAERLAAEAQRRQIEQSEAAKQQSGTQQGTQQAGEGSAIPSPEGSTQSANQGQAPASAAGEVQTRAAALARNPRVKIDTPSLSGSINLRGARIDDLQLKGYRETIKPNSALITLLSPSEDKEGFFAELGWVAGENMGDVPGPDTLWTLSEGQTLTPSTPVKLTFTNSRGITFTRTVSVDSEYMFTLVDNVANAAGAAVTGSPYARVTRYHKPKTPENWILHEGAIGVAGEEGLQEGTYSEMEDNREIKLPTATGGWLGFTDKYWAAAVIPAASFTGRFSYLDDGRPRWQADYLGEAVTVEAGKSAEVTQRLFAGAKEVAEIDKNEKLYSIRNFDLLIDWGWFYFITKPMFWLLDNLFKLVGNFGIAILLGTVIIKLFLFPLANMSYKSMAQMKNMQPEMLAIRERFAEDKVRQQQEMMALYKREKINPAAGCWPILVQIPIFFALYKVLFITIEMRHAPFFGWIQDLAAPDPTSIFNLFGLIPWEVPAFLLIGVWPLIMGVTMFLQMQMNPTPPDPTQAMIFKWMPIIFTFMLATFPAGLVIYWAWNNSLSIIQQAVIMRKYGTKIELLDNLRSLFKPKPKPAD